MTHWSEIDRTTRVFTDESYKPLHTPSEYLYTTKQKEQMEAKRLKKEEDEKARRYRDMEERRRSQSMRPAN